MNTTKKITKQNIKKNKSKKSLVVEQTLAQDMIVRSIKIIYIGYVTVIYFVISFHLSIFFDKVIFGKFDPEKYDKKNTIIILLELILHLFFILVLTYILRNLVELIPFPLNNLNGFQIQKVKELTSGAIFFVIFIWNQHYFMEKLKYLYNRYKW